MFIIFFLLSTFDFTCSNVHIALETESLKSSTKCISFIVQKYFMKRSTISVFTARIPRYNTELKEIYKDENYDKILLNLTNFNVNFLDTENRYSIILGKDINDYIAPSQVNNLASLNVKSQIIFYVFNNSEYLLKEFVETIWNYYIINAIVMMPSLQNEEILNIYSLFPYSGDNCGKTISPVLINSCTHGILQTTTNLFSNKIPLNLQGCPVRLRVVIFPPYALAPEDGRISNDVPVNFTDGVEIQMIKTIASFANFTIEFTSSTTPDDWGVVTDDGNITGNIKVIQEKRADICVGGYGVTLGRNVYCDFTASHMQEIMTWCVPRAQQSPQWKKMLAPFQTKAWLAMVSSYFLISFIVWFLSYIPPRDISAYVNISNSFAFIFTTFLGQTVPAMPNKISVRILFFMWLFFGLHFVAAYQAKLIGVLSKPRYENQMSSLDEILSKGMIYQIVPTHLRFFTNPEDWREATILREYTECFHSDACLRRVASDRAFAFFISRTHLEFEALKYRNSDGESLVFCIDYLSFPVTFYMSKGYPLRDRINDLICRIRGSGLMVKWEQSIKWIWSFKFRNTLPKNTKEQILRLEHMEGAFLVLALGIAIALVIFMIELIYFQVLSIWN